MERSALQELVQASSEYAAHAELIAELAVELKNRQSQSESAEAFAVEAAELLMEASRRIESAKKNMAGG